ncbi:MAG: hypothetical protein ACRDJ1_01975 [Actinomycetota bacterium]
MKKARSYLGITALVVVLGVLAACGTNDKTPVGSGSTPPSTPATTTHTETEWTIVTPAGWTKEVWTSKTDAEKAIRYSNANGDYFIVAIDPLGSDFSADAIWRYDVKGNVFEVVEKTDCTGEELCSTKDQRWDAWALWKSGSDPEKVGGHVYYFVFGNTQKTTVDQPMYEAILESIQVKA